MRDKELERTLKAFANIRRLQILRYLKQEKEAFVGNIADHIRLSFKATSKHLVILSMSDLVEKEQRSVQMFYRLSGTRGVVTRSVISQL